MTIRTSGTAAGWAEIDPPRAGRIRRIGIPVKFSETPGAIRTPAPEMGEHTEEILKAHG